MAGLNICRARVLPQGLPACHRLPVSADPHLKGYLGTYWACPSRRLVIEERVFSTATSFDSSRSTIRVACWPHFRSLCESHFINSLSALVPNFRLSWTPGLPAQMMHPILSLTRSVSQTLIESAVLPHKQRPNRWQVIDPPSMPSAVDLGLW